MKKLYQQIVSIDFTWIYCFFKFYYFAFTILENLYTVCLITHKKRSLQNFKPLFPVILRIFDHKCHGETSLKAYSV